MWPIDTTDWDRIYTHYYELFSQASLADSTWERYWKELTSTLIDHHLSVLLERPSSRTLVYLNPGMDEVEARPYYHVRSTSVSCLNQLVSLGRMSDTAQTETFYYGVIDDSIAYLRISTFNITELMTQEAYH